MHFKLWFLVSGIEFSFGIIGAQSDLHCHPLQDTGSSDHGQCVGLQEIGIVVSMEVLDDLCDVGADREYRSKLTRSGWASPSIHGLTGRVF